MSAQNTAETGYNIDFEATKLLTVIELLQKRILRKAIEKDLVKKDRMFSSNETMAYDFIQTASLVFHFALTRLIGHRQ